MVRPVKTLILFIYIVIMLGILMILPDEIALLNDQSIKIPKISAVFFKPKVETADISNIIEEFSEPDEKPITVDTTQNKDTVDTKRPPRRIDSLSIRDDLRIQFPENKENLLDNFFTSLRLLEENPDTSLRVIHFG